MERFVDDLRFGWIDYLLFALTLLVSSFVGVYHAWKGASSSTSNYLMGGRKLGIFPIAMSLAASTISATTMLGVPTDTYLTGSMYVWSIVGCLIGIPAASYLYLPVFHRLKIISANKYLELRFNAIIRRMLSFLYIVKQLFFLAMVVYAPSLALQQVTGMEVYISVTIIFVVCTFYTSIGGLKAVVWTDTIQIFLMYGSMIAIIVKGVVDVGGIEIAWERNVNGSRIEFFNMDIDPTTRHTIWSLVIGGGFYMASFATNQIVVQRYLASPTLLRAHSSMWGFLFAMSGVSLLSIVAGLVAYAKYFDCDPIASKSVQKPDQLIPYFLMDTLGHLPGLPGLFVAGIFSGALSSLSSALNAVALIVLEDFIRPFYPHLEDRTATWITKVVSLAFGCISFGSVFLIANVKTILEASISFNGAVAGAMMGVFTLGLFIPWANSIGAGVGMIVSCASMMYLGISTQFAKARGILHNPQTKPVSLDSCAFANVTSLTAIGEQVPEREEAFVLLRISYTWYTLIGVVIVLVVGTLVSIVTGAQDPGKLNPNLVCGLIRRQVGRRREEPVTDHNSEMLNLMPQPTAPRAPPLQSSL